MEGSRDRTKHGATKTRKEATKVETAFWEDYKKVIKKITTPTAKEWWETLWRVAVILVIFGAMLFALDSLLLAGSLKFQTALSPMGIRWVEIVYGALVFLVGLVATVSILATTGGTEGGLSSMLGSGVQYGDTTGEFGKKISKTTFTSSGLLMVMILFSPLFLGGM